MVKRPLIVGNWKMNGSRASLAGISTMGAHFEGDSLDEMRVVICPPAILIPDAMTMSKHISIEIGAQDCHWQASGAYTGDISAAMLKDYGVSLTIIGHSERRQYHNETNAAIGHKMVQALENDLFACLCVGESLAEREAGHAEAAVEQNLDACLSMLPSSLLFDGKPVAEKLAIAYEPLWAIGSGQLPTGAEIDNMHTLIRRFMNEKYPIVGEQISILYGGSVKTNNARDILARENVGGLLIGGASLKAMEFIEIVEKCRP